MIGTMNTKCPCACHKLPPRTVVHVVSCCELYSSSTSGVPEGADEPGQSERVIAQNQPAQAIIRDRRYGRIMCGRIRFRCHPAAPLALKSCLPLVFLAPALLWAQPDPALLRRLFEECLARYRTEFGAADPRTAQAARDLANFLLTQKDRGGARQALAEALRIDEKAMGESAAQTLEDAGALAAVSPQVQAEPLLRRAAESPDPTVAGPALTSAAAIRMAAGDRAGAAVLLRRAVNQAEAADGKDSPIVAAVLVALSEAVDVQEAIPALQRAVAIEEKTMGAADAQTVRDVSRLAELLRRAGPRE